MSSVSVKANRCIRCGYIWPPRRRKLGQTKVCPRCRTPYWSRPYTRANKRR